MINFRIGSEIELRPFSEDDAEQAFAVVKENLEHLHPFLHWAVESYSPASAREFIAQAKNDAEARKSLGFGIFKNGTLIGSIGFVNFNWNSRRTEIGYWIAKGYEGRAIITQSCKLLINYAFDELQLNRIEIHCAFENARSRAIPEKLGFVQEGILRQSEWRHTRFYDMVIYGLLKNEWEGSECTL